jgi:hypothetical protein
MLTLEAGLLKQLQSERARKRAKLPFKPALFGKIQALVQEYGLEEDFLGQIDELTDHRWLEKPKYDRIKVKKNLEVPLFALSTPEEYGLTLAIIEKVNNPYLPFANSPEEILVCNALFQCDPAIEPQKLASHHFHTLLLCCHAEVEVQVLTQRLRGETAGLVGASHKSLQERLGQLQKFLTGVQDLERQRDDSHV